MKQYFLAFDFYSEELGIDKFSYGINSIDLNKQHIDEVAKQIIRDNFVDICPDSVTIKVTALNNIEM